MAPVRGGHDLTARPTLQLAPKVVRLVALRDPVGDLDGSLVVIVWQETRADGLTHRSELCPDS
jgi:hypothetical protein